MLRRWAEAVKGTALRSGENLRRACWVRVLPDWGLTSRRPSEVTARDAWGIREKMKPTMRWFGPNDPVPLEWIRQVPGIKGVVSSLDNIPVGQVWPVDAIRHLKQIVEDSGLTLEVVESLGVHEDIKLGLPTRDMYIENYCQTIRNLAMVGVKVVCYNFMPVFDWLRTNLESPLPDGSVSLSFENERIVHIDPLNDDLILPGWTISYGSGELRALIERYRGISEDDLWDNLKYFLEAVIPVAEEVDVKMAIHPDDPPWSVFGIPRIIVNRDALDRVIDLVDSPCNGITFCTGSLGVDPKNNIPEMIRYFGSKQRIHFAHVRNVKILGHRSFQETAHLSECGSLDMVEIMKAFYESGFDGPMRPDHGRMIWGERGRPGYGLYDRALGLTYLNGIWETLSKVHQR